MKMNRYLQTFLIVIAILIVSATFTKATTNVSSCENITTPGYYILNQSLNYSYPENYCISISSDNVTLDGNGYWINGYNGDNTGNVSSTAIFFNSTNDTIKNIIMYDNYRCFGPVLSYTVGPANYANLAQVYNSTCSYAWQGTLGNYNNSIIQGNNFYNVTTVYQTDVGGVLSQYGSNNTFDSNTVSDNNSFNQIASAFIVSGGDTFSNNNVYINGIGYDMFEGSIFYYFNLINNTFSGNLFGGQGSKDYMDTEGVLNNNFYWSGNTFNMSNDEYIFDPTTNANTTNFTFINNIITDKNALSSNFGNQNFYNSTFANNVNLGSFGGGDTSSNVTAYNNTNVIFRVANAINVYLINDTFNSSVSSSVSVSGGEAFIQAPVDFTILNSTQNPINSNLTVQDLLTGSINNFTQNLPSGSGQFNITTLIANSSGVFNVLNNYTASSTGLASNTKLRSFNNTTEFTYPIVLLPTTQTCGNLNLTSNTNYTLYYDLYSNGSCLNISSSIPANFTCFDSPVNGNYTESGISVDSNNIQISNCTINNFTNGIYNNNNNNHFFSNTFENSENGMLDSGSNSLVEYNYFINTTTPYYLNNSVNSSIYNNTFDNTTENTIILNNASNSRIYENNFGYGANGTTILNSNNINVFNNTFFGVKFELNISNSSNLNYSFNNYTNTNLEPLASLNILDNIQNSNIISNNLTGNSGFNDFVYLIENSYNNTIYNNTATGFNNGIKIENSTNDKIIQNNVINLITSNNTQTIIENNTLTTATSTLNQSENSTIVNNTFVGASVFNSSNNNFTSNTLGNFTSNYSSEEFFNQNNATSLKDYNGINNTYIQNNLTTLSLTLTQNSTIQNNTIQQLNELNGNYNNILNNTFNSTSPLLLNNTSYDNLQNNIVLDNSSMVVTLANYSYNTSVTHYNNSLEEVFVNSTVDNALTISADKTTLPAGYADGSDNISAGFVNVVGSGNITVMFNSTLASNCTQLVTFLNTILPIYTITCYDVETVFIANGVNNSYIYTPPMNLTLDAGLLTPFLNAVYNPKTVALNGSSENILNSNNININQENAGVDYVNNTTNTLISNSNLAGLVIDNGLNVTILNDTINNASDSANASFTNYIITNNTYNYTVQWFASLNVSLNGSPKNTSVNATDSFGNNYFQNSTNSSGLTNWFIVNDYEKSNSGLTNFNPYFLSFADPTTISANFTQTQTLTVNLNPNQTNLTASINPNILSTSGYTVTTTLYINNTFNSTIDISCTPSQSWLSVNCSSTIANNTNENFTITINPSFSSSGSYNGGIAVQYQNGTNYYTAYPNVTVQYTAPYYGGGGGYVAPVSKQTNQTNTTTTVSNNSVSNTSTATNTTPTIPVANVTNKTPVYNITNTTLPSTPKNVTIPIQNNSSLIAQPATHATNWFDDYKYYFLSLIIILLIILAYLAYKKRPEKETPISAIISEENQQPKTPLN